MRPVRWLRWALRLVGPLVLLALLCTTDLAALGAALAGVHPGWVAGAVAGWVAMALVKAWRWQQILGRQGIAVPWAQAARWYLAGLFLGGVSPGRLGELVKVAFIRDLGHSTGRALFSSVLDRLYDLVLLPMVAVAGMLLYGAVFARELGTVGVALGLAVAGLAVLWRGRRLLALPVRAMMPATAREQARLTVDDFMADLRSVSWRDLVVHGGVTAACWIGYAASLDLLAIGLGVDVDPVYLGVAVLAAALAGLLPITISGVGTRDAVLAIFFLRVGASTADAIAMSTLVLAVNVAVIVLYWPAYQLSVRGRSDQ